MRVYAGICNNMLEMDIFFFFFFKLKKKDNKKACKIAASQKVRRPMRVAEPVDEPAPPTGY